MAQDPRALALRWYEEIFNQGRLETVDELMAPDAVIHGGGLDVRPIRGPSALKEHLAALREAFPDLHVRVEEVLVDGDRVAIRCVASGTHLGSALGVEPTGRKTVTSGMTVGHWRDGRLVEGWSHWDLLSFYRELGVLGLFDTVRPG